MPTGWIVFLVITGLTISAIVQFWRGFTGQTRTYDGWDMWSALVETSLIIWAIFVLAQR